MRRPEPEAVALTADRTKAMAVALAGMDADRGGRPRGARGAARGSAAVILGFHPEHVRRLIRTGRLRAHAGRRRLPGRVVGPVAAPRGPLPPARPATNSPTQVTSIRVVPSAALTVAEWSGLTDLCESAFKRSWGDFWESMGPGVHVIAEDDGGRILAHGAIVDRLLDVGDGTLRSAYVEAVAVLPERQRRGLGTEVMQVIDRMVDEGYELGALGTGTHAFYARLGWVIWRGPTFIRERDGRLTRSADGDGGIMVLRTPITPAGPEPLAPDRDRMERFRKASRRARGEPSPAQ